MTTVPTRHDSIRRDSIRHDNEFVPPENFVGRLQQLASLRADDPALIVVAEREGESFERVLSYQAFATRVRALAAQLQRRFEPGDRVLILLDNDEHYAVSLFACFHAGVIAVPVFPPESARPQHLARLLGIAQDAGPRGILTLAALGDLVAGAARSLGEPTIVAVDEIDLAAASGWRDCEPGADDIAFLQYTSGSTSAPKGVMVTHGNLMANERAIRQGLSIGADDRFLVWSPLFHDMGLIGGLLQPFYSGIPCVLTTPRYFLERPVRWLELVSRHRATISGGPDFAYRLCVERVKDSQIDGLDLSSWRVAYTGAEPVRQDTMDAFIERYRPRGFDPGAVYPCYGLAEATLFVSGGERGRGMAVQRYDAAALAQREVVPAADGRALVGCGQAPDGHRIRIADAVSGECIDTGRIGEILVAGPSIAAGYWGKPAESAETFVVRDGQRWLCTGDLGFVDGGELFVAGRLKDMIIVRGHNVYPHDVERAIEAEVEAVRKGRVAAFAVGTDGGEGVGVCAEVSRGLQKLIAPQALADAIGAAVAEQCGEPPEVVVLLNPGALPKTSSGKLQRGACRAGWIDGSLDAYAAFRHGVAVGAKPGEADDRAAPPALSPAVGDRGAIDEIQTTLADLWREVLPSAPGQHYGPDAHFFSAGGNSLGTVGLAERISRHWQIAFPTRALFEATGLGQQAALIAGMLAAPREVHPAVIAPLDAIERHRPMALSPAQQRQWFLWKLDPQGTAYHVQGALRLAGELDINALRIALAALVERHEALRTIFSEGDDGEPEQRVLPRGRIELQVFDPVPGTGVQPLLEALNAEPFDLCSGPLVRAALIRAGSGEQVLALVVHHIIVDGASMQILVEDLALLYEASLGRRPVPEAPVLQALDVVAWLRSPAQAAAQAAQLDYWCRQLAVAPGDAQPVLSLPTDRPHQGPGRYHAGRHAFDLAPDLVRRLRELAARHRTTLATVLLAGYQMLLYRHAGSSDIRVGMPVANRSMTVLERVTGLFVNTVVLRNRIGGAMTLAQVLDAAARDARGALANADCSFETVVDVVQPMRTPGVNPLFQVMFNHLQEDFERFADLAIIEQLSFARHAQFELTLDTRERVDGGVGGFWTYAAELFEAATIERMAGHYERVLEQMAMAPEQTVAALEMLGASEREQLRRWGVNTERYPTEEPIHRLIERQAEQAPAATALVFGGQRLDRAELDRRANRLARCLREHGAGPETRVGVALQRSIELVVTLLAVLKTGAAYVPLDPDYPSERLQFMAGDSDVCLVVTSEALATQVRPERRDGGSVRRMLILDGLDLSGFKAGPLDQPVHPDNLAYVIYTSGSTGRPKGAAISHRSLVNCMQWMQQTYRITPENDAVLHKAPFGFDVSVWEIFWPLSAGVPLVVAQPEDHRDPERIIELIRAHRITALNFVPTMLQMFLGHQGVEGETGLRFIMCGGEAMPGATKAEALRRLSGVSLQNLYGPTETTIHVTQWSCRDDGSSQVPIGAPIGHTSCHVLDSDLNEVPQGVAGELYIGGVGLARGYLGQAGLSAERFVADPFDEQGGGRLYRTGDLVRWNGDGQLEYLGRIDHQVKIRGFRIELGEIEAQLLGEPEVREAVVVAHEDGDAAVGTGTSNGAGSTRLVGYVSLQPGRNVAPAELRQRLGRRLPDYMVPSVVMVLKALPLNANGKVDRKALPAPEWIGSVGYQAPRGELETRLAAIWAEAVGVAQVGRHDNFFEVGGNSLSLIRVHRAIQQHLGPSELRVTDLFRCPTIEDLAVFMDRDLASSSCDAAAAIASRADRRKQALRQKQRELLRAQS